MLLDQNFFKKHCILKVTLDQTLDKASPVTQLCPRRAVYGSFPPQAVLGPCFSTGKHGQPPPARPHFVPATSRNEMRTGGAYEPAPPGVNAGPNTTARQRTMNGPGNAGMIILFAIPQQNRTAPVRSVHIGFQPAQTLPHGRGSDS